MKKTFDWVDRDMLLFKLMSQFDIRGRLYEAIRYIYSLSSARVKVNHLYTEEFPTYYEVKQGDT